MVLGLGGRMAVFCAAASAALVLLLVAVVQSAVVPASAEEGPSSPAVALVLDGGGRVVATSTAGRYPLGARLADLAPVPAGRIASVLAGGASASGAWSRGGQLVRWSLDPVRVADGPARAVYAETAAPAVPGASGLQPFPVWLGGLALALWALAAAAGMRTMGRTARRLRALAAAGRGLAGAGAPPAGGDEVGQLERQLTAVAARLDGAVREAGELGDRRGRLDERRRLAGSLHDSVAQDLSGIRMELAALIGRHAGDAVLRDRLAALDMVAADAVRSVRGLLLELHPPSSDGLDLETALRDLGASYASRLGIAVELRLEAAAVRDSVREVLVQVAREALANVARHAGARRVEVELAAAGDRVALVVADNGTGFPADAARAGLGLRIARERVEEVGGRLTVESAPGRGTSLRATVPAPRP